MYLFYLSIFTFYLLNPRHSIPSPIFYCILLLDFFHFQFLNPFQIGKEVWISVNGSFMPAHWGLFVGSINEVPKSRMVNFIWCKSQGLGPGPSPERFGERKVTVNYLESTGSYWLSQNYRNTYSLWISVKIVYKER